MNQQNAVIATPLNKISVKSVFGAIPVQAVKEDGKDVLRLPAAIVVMRVIGQATGYEVKQSDFGDSLKFKGTFKAWNLDTGEVFNSSACFLPNIVEGQLGAVLDEHDAVEFAFDIGVVPAKNANGYEYRVKPLVAATEAPVFAALEAKIAPLPQLGAPGEPGKAEKSSKPAKK